MFRRRQSSDVTREQVHAVLELVAPSLNKTSTRPLC